MSSMRIRETIDEFLALIRDGEGSAEHSEFALCRLLDALALARHEICVGFDESDYPDPPDWPYDARRKVVSERFPDLGFYNVVQQVSTHIGDAELAVGDAIDDIADIAGDLANVAWAWRNTSELDALWHFEHSYVSHWGRHLRDLQQYLYARRSEE